MFDREFYPTPAHVIQLMTAGLDLNGKIVLEPSAGSGNIVDYAQSMGAEVIACERHKDLQRLVGSKCRIIKPDFFDVTSDDISHIDYIIMNPPFSNADKHIQHAFDIAPEGCTIVAICNASTLKNDFSTRRTVLKETIEKNGNWSILGNVFSDADRETDVSIALVRMVKPRTGDSEFSDYFFDMSDEEEDLINGSGIVKHNEIREIVNRYVAAVKNFESVIASSNEINRLISPISDGLGITFGAHSTRNNISSTITRDIFKKELQKSAWKSVFNKFNMGKYVTKSVLDDINKFVEQQQAVPFTMNNIFKMIEMIIGTHASRMDKVLEEAFDRICSLSADNSEAGEKWKTNSNYKVNRRFIMTWICEHDKLWQTEHVKIRIGSGYDRTDDIVKALCHLTGKNFDNVMAMTYKNEHGFVYDSIKTLYNFFSHNKTEWGKWVQWNDFFNVRGYKKGTMHFEFVSEDVWMEFNKRVARIKGWAIPQKTDKKSKGTERAKTSGVEVYASNLFD